jgi:hypothetical protein
MLRKILPISSTCPASKFWNEVDIEEHSVGLRLSDETLAMKRAFISHSEKMEYVSRLVSVSLFSIFVVFHNH